MSLAALALSPLADHLLAELVVSVLFLFDDHSLVGTRMCGVLPLHCVILLVAWQLFGSPPLALHS